MVDRLRDVMEFCSWVGGWAQRRDAYIDVIAIMSSYQYTIRYFVWHQIEEF